MDLQLEGKTALVTGASAGIGRAIATGLAAEGVQTAIVARRPDLLESLSAEIVASGHKRPEVIVQDVMDVDSAERLRHASLQALGRVDILINCAGGSRPLPVDAPPLGKRLRRGFMSPTL